MAIVLMGVFFLVFGKSPLFPVQVIGSTVFGESALQGFNAKALIAGLLIHQLGPSLIWGLVYGIVARGLNINQTIPALVLGIILGVVSMIDVYILVPLVMKALQGVDYWNQEVPIFWDWAAHIVFGASFIFYAAIHDAISHRSQSKPTI